METDLLHNPHVGEILKHEFLEELEINEITLAEAIGVSAISIQEIITGKAAITAEIDL